MGHSHQRTSVAPKFWDTRSDLMWTPPPHRIELVERDQSLSKGLKEKFGESVAQAPQVSDMLTFHVTERPRRRVLTVPKAEATPKYLRLDDLDAIDESAWRVSSLRGLFWNSGS
jgi:NADH-quinone oxidoreductase subunit B/C/D